MVRFAILCFSSVLFAQSGAGPLAGRWNFTIETPGGTRAMWLKVEDQGGVPTVWFQPTGGNVYQIKDFQIAGAKLTARINENSSLALTAQDGKLVGSFRRGQNDTPLAGLPAPKLNRPAPKSWGKPEPLFNGKDLTGWEPMGDPSKSKWIVRDGLLVNEALGANLKSVRKFDDFKLHFEVKCPNEANSGFYLRGRYEIQLEYHPNSTSPAERRMASIYGRIAPKELPPTPGQWESFDVTFVGRTLTVVRNGVTIIDRQEVEGITGGAIDANEGEPGPFYIQGDHTGGLEFRNITVSLPKR